uniref:gamma-glutamylcyclotransferase family protein n=1 Tax=Marinobacterium profundum TaxID=1714300 RepID=UPI00082EDA6C|nr:gamma-glutamylcyclotransferase family protein [Marinobacterium profundum]
MLYFAYGSNLSERRLRARISSVIKVANGVLDGHQLRFHKVSQRDGSAKCDVFATGVARHFVLGVVFEVSESDRDSLDRYEGLNCGYEARDILVRLEDGSSVSAFTYCATRIDSALLPFDWYREHVLRGAQEHGFAHSYIQQIEVIECVTDPDEARCSRELAIYR